MYNISASLQEIFSFIIIFAHFLRAYVDVY